METTIQKIKLVEKDNLDVAVRYYKLLSALSKNGLTNREIQLISFTAIKGNMSYSTNRQEFCATYKSTPATINNIISKLKKLGLLIKDGTKVKVHPQYLVDFNTDLILQITLKNG